MEWIRVEDRLPEDGAEVLTSDGKTMSVADYSSYSGWSAMAAGELARDWHDDVIARIKVTHWMPVRLPKTKG